MTTLSEARARVRELSAVIAAGKQAQTEAEAKYVPIEKRRAAARARLEKVALLTQAAASPQRNVTLTIGDTRKMTLAEIHLGYGEHAVKASTLATSLLAQGGAKVTPGGSSVSYTLRGMLARTRTVDKANLAAIERAERKVTRATKALKAAAAELRGTYDKAFEAGQKLDPKAIAEQIAPVLVANPYQRHANDDPRVEAAWAAQREMNVARLHLNWLEQDEDGWRKLYSQTGGVPSEKPATCPCDPCRDKERAAAAIVAEDARLDGLRTILIDCPAEGHGRHRMATEDVSFEVTDKRRTEWTAITPELAELLPPAPRDYWASKPSVTVQVTHCRKGKAPVGYIRTKALAARLALEKVAAEKAAAREAKKAPKRLARVAAVEVHEGDMVAFTCPVDGSEQESVTEAADNGELYVGCDDCENGFAITRLANVHKVSAAAA